MTASLVFVLHAHLPLVRDPEDDDQPEDRWLFDALAESYLPLLAELARLVDERVPFRVTISLSPTLVAMLRDPLLLARFERWLGLSEALCAQELARTRGTDTARVVRFHARRLASVRAAFEALGGDVLSGFRALAEAGVVELATTAATHAFLPLYAAIPGAIDLQLGTALRQHTRVFGRAPTTLWLPECGFGPGLDAALVRRGVRATVLDSHALLHARPRPPHGVWAPVLTPAGLAVLGRDPASSRQVWSRAEGYPGDPRYLEHHRDVGFDRPHEEVRAFLPRGLRVATGLRYWRVTGDTGDKALYDPELAREAAMEHAAHFVAMRSAQADALRTVMDRPAVITCPYDCELFGHWWAEGPWFLAEVLRRVASSGGALRSAAVRDVLHGDAPVCVPSASSWGEGGHAATWAGERTAELLAPVLRATDACARLCRELGDDRRPAVRAALRAACEELLLAQASDWAFMVHQGTTAGYARTRVAAHLDRFEALHRALREPALPSWLDDPWTHDTLRALIEPGDLARGSTDRTRAVETIG